MGGDGGRALQPRDQLVALHHLLKIFSKYFYLVKSFSLLFKKKKNQLQSTCNSTLVSGRHLYNL